MRVIMQSKISGTRDGEDWPNPGGSIDLPGPEAADLVANGYAVIEPEPVVPAVEPEPVVETAVAPVAETATKALTKGA